MAWRAAWPDDGDGFSFRLFSSYVRNKTSVLHCRRMWRIGRESGSYSNLAE